METLGAPFLDERGLLVVVGVLGVDVLRFFVAWMRWRGASRPPL